MSKSDLIRTILLSIRMERLVPSNLSSEIPLAAYLGSWMFRIRIRPKSKELLVVWENHKTGERSPYD